MNIPSDNLDLPTIEEVDGLPAVTRASPDVLRNLLGILEHELRVAGFDRDRELRAGIGVAETSAQLRAVGLHANFEVLTWFGWANGGAMLPSGGPLASLDEACTYYRTVQIPAIENPEPGLDGADWGAPMGFLMLGVTNRTFAIDCRQAVVGAPEVHATNEDFHSIETPLNWRFRSLATLITWWIQSLRSGAYTWNPRVNAWSLVDAKLVPSLQRERQIHF